MQKMCTRTFEMQIEQQ